MKKIGVVSNVVDSGLNISNMIYRDPESVVETYVSSLNVDVIEDDEQLLKQVTLGFNW